MARKSWLESRLAVIDERTNGPALCAVFQTVRAATRSVAVAAPSGPKRSAAQISTGKTTYGTSRWSTSSASGHERHNQRGRLGRPKPGDARRARQRPGQDHRRDDDHAAQVGEEPGAQHLAHLVGADHVAERAARACPRRR